MIIGKTLYVKNREEWRKWLSENYLKETEIWIVYFRKASGKPTIPYDEAVEEALCFGWIDSTEKRIDSEKFAGRFTPRRDKSNLSESNRIRAMRLIAEGKMTEFGLSKIKKQLES